MGDFVILGEAMAQAMGHQPGEFTRALRSNQATSSITIDNSSAVKSAVLAYFRDGNKNIKRMQCQTAQNLLEGYTSLPEDWPEHSRKFSAELRNLVPELSDIGIEVIFYDRIGGGIPVSIIKSLPKQNVVVGGIGETEDFLDYMANRAADDLDEDVA